MPEVTVALGAPGLGVDRSGDVVWPTPFYLNAKPCPPELLGVQAWSHNSNGAPATRSGRKLAAGQAKGSHRGRCVRLSGIWVAHTLAIRHDQQLSVATRAKGAAEFSAGL